MITTINQLTDHFGGAIGLAEAIKVKPESVRMWRSRGFVPPMYADEVRRCCDLEITGRVFRMYEVDDAR